VVSTHSSDLDANKALVREFWHAPADDKMRVVTNDACWHLPLSVQWRGVDREIRGEALRELFAGSVDRYGHDRTWEVHHVVAEGNLVALHATMHARTNIGREYHGSYHVLFRIDRGHIAEAWEFLDTAYVFECLQPDQTPSLDA
jgi:ketosteroid isomerase-like protein